MLDAAQWQELLADNPLLDHMSDPSRLLVAIWRQPEGRAIFERFAAQEDWAPDRVAIGRHGGYLWCSEGLLASRAANAMDKALRDDCTSRNWATALKIGALLQPAA